MTYTRIHRETRPPPAGNPHSNKRLALCGSYIIPEFLTRDPDKVTCGSCIRATTSERTERQRRLEFDD